MKRSVSFLGILVATVLTMHATTDVVYTPDYCSTIFKNPERGFTEELSRKVTVDKPNVVKGNLSSNWGNRYNMTLAVVLYNFKYFKSQDLPEEILTGFDEDMQELRNYGLKCVLRFAYSETTSDNVDATPEWVQRHLQQLKPHLEQNADVIYVMEAGFVGVWGEWYYTANYGNESQHVNANRRLVIDALMANTPADRFVLFRYPMIKTEYFGDSNTLSENEAFTGSVRARMGHHNDAFLNDWGNDGTYASDDKSDDPAMRQYIADETRYVPNGGETNVESSSTAKRVYKKATTEMREYHWSFCGSSYATAVTNRWREDGIFDTLNMHMGYRLCLLQARYCDSIAPGGKMPMAIRIANVGYAPLYNERPVFIVLKNAEHTYRMQLSADPRRWLPGKHLLQETLDVPADIAEGTYHLYLHLPDKYATIAADPRYAVRLANVDTWDETTGLNDLKADIVVSASAPLEPDELPELIDALPTVSADKTADKILENGVLYIVRNGVRYTVSGQITE